MMGKTWWVWQIKKESIKREGDRIYRASGCDMIRRVTRWVGKDSRACVNRGRPLLLQSVGDRGLEVVKLEVEEQNTEALGGESTEKEEDKGWMGSTGGGGGMGEAKKTGL